VLALWPLGVRGAEDFKGLDLTADEPKKEEPKKEEEKPVVTAPPPSEPSAAKAPEAKLNEVEIVNEDRVKSVQRKAFLKHFRLELTPMTFITVNDSFYPKTGPGGRLAFYIADNLGIAVRYYNYQLIPTDEVRLAKRELQSKLPAVQPNHSFNLDLLWSPVYGKVSIFNTIHTFDIYLVGGAGAFLTQTSDSGDGPHFSAHVGLGERFTVTDFFAVDLSVLETLYADRPGGGAKSTLQNLVSVNLGLSFFIPFSFEYKEL
jgi:outer membrane beta-barrel protein